MKLRNLSIFAVAAMLAACGGDDAAEGDATVTADSPSVIAPAPMPAPATPMPGDSAMMGGDSMSHDSMGGMSHDSMSDTTKM